MGILKAIASGVLLLWGASAFSADLEPQMNAKVCNSDNSSCAGVTGSRLDVNATQATSPWVTSAAQSGTWNLRLQDGSGNAVSSTTGWLDVNVKASALPAGAATSANQSTEITSLQIIDNIPHPNDSALNNGAPIMGQLDDVSTGTVAENNVSTVRMTAARGLHFNLRNNAGTEIGTSSNPVRIDPTGTTRQPTYVDSDGTKATYSACATDIASAIAATDVFTITGSGTKTIKIIKFMFSGTETTGAVRDVALVKRSAANSGGTSATAASVPLDSNSSAATATVRSYTANPTLGTTVGSIENVAWAMPATNLSGQNGVLKWDWGNHPEQEPVLRGTGEVLAINLQGVTWSGSDLEFCVEFTEE